MNIIEQIIGPFFDNANSLFEAFMDIAITFFGFGYVFVRLLTEIVGGVW